MMTSAPNRYGFTLLCCVVVAILTLRAVMAGDTRMDRDASTSPQSAASADSEAAVTGQAGAEATTGSSDAASVHRRRAELAEVMQFAQKAYARINDEVSDYTCIMYKREFVDGEVSAWQSMTAKIRHEKRINGVTQVPFSVYLRFLKPEKFADRAVLYVQNQNNGDLIGRRGGRRNPNMTVQLVPTGLLAMEGNRYPITEIGFQNLAKRLIEVLEQELEYRDGELEVFENAKVGDRKCTHFRLTHHKRRPNLTYHMAEVSVDDELGIPIRYGAYDFPRQEGGKPQLLEQYVYTNVQINVGLTDDDFDPRNPSYGFQLMDETDVVAK